MTDPAPAALRSKEAELRAAFWDQVATFPNGFKIRDCIQCGTCTGSCPVAHAMDITPREIVALFRAGFLEDILRSRSIWICASCYACTVRCPQGIRVTDSVYALKRLAAEKGIFPKTFPAHALSEAFVGNIHSFGRNWELWFGLKYYLSTNPAGLLSPNIQKFAIRMLKRKRLGLKPARIHGMKEVRAIIKKAQSMGGL
ncbi:MAG: 4Fe-4S dicluster domain-containing protein [Thermoanaerobaculaceae bacterium]|jgi:heterodisulfide reductase subunit C